MRSSFVPPFSGSAPSASRSFFVCLPIDATSVSSFFCHSAHNSFSNRDVVLQQNVFLKPQREPVLQFFARRIDQENAEHLEINQLT